MIQEIVHPEIKTVLAAELPLNGFGSTILHNEARTIVQTFYISPHFTHPILSKMQYVDTLWAGLAPTLHTFFTGSPV